MFPGLDALAALGVAARNQNAKKYYVNWSKRVQNIIATFDPVQDDKIHSYFFAQQFELQVSVVDSKQLKKLKKDVQKLKVPHDKEFSEQKYFGLIKLADNPEITFKVYDKDFVVGMKHTHDLLGVDVTGESKKPQPFAEGMVLQEGIKFTSSPVSSIYKELIETLEESKNSYLSGYIAIPYLDTEMTQHYYFVNFVIYHNKELDKVEIVWVDLKRRRHLEAADGLQTLINNIPSVHAQNKPTEVHYLFNEKVVRATPKIRVKIEESIEQGFVVNPK